MMPTSDSLSSHSFLLSQLQELKQMFAMYDKDKSGHLEYTVGMTAEYMDPTSLHDGQCIMD